MWTIETALGRILIRPTGYLDLEGSASAADIFEAELARLEGPCALYIDLQELDGYEAEVRHMWQEVIHQHRHRFYEMVWVSDRAVFRMVAASVSLVIGIPSRVVGSAEDPMRRAM